MSIVADLIGQRHSLNVNKHLFNSIGLKETITYYEILSRYEHEHLDEKGYIEVYLNDLSYITTISKTELEVIINKLHKINLITSLKGEIYNLIKVKVNGDINILIDLIKEGAKRKPCTAEIEVSATTNDISGEVISDWEAIKSMMSQQMTDVSFKTWIKPLDIYQEPDNNYNLHILVANEFTREMVTNKYLDLMKQIAKSVNPKINILKVRTA